MTPDLLDRDEYNRMYEEIQASAARVKGIAPDPTSGLPDARHDGEHQEPLFPAMMGESIDYREVMRLKERATQAKLDEARARIARLEQVLDRAAHVIDAMSSDTAHRLMIVGQIQEVLYRP